MISQILKDPAPYPMVYIPPNVGYWEESLNNANPESTSRVLQESTDIYEDEGNTAYRKYFLGQVRVKVNVEGHLLHDNLWKMNLK